MKAIILSCDKYLPFADHTIYSYLTVWKTNPFLFRVPYGEIYPEDINNKYGNRVEIIQTDAAKVEHLCNQVDTDSEEKIKVSLIKKTVLDLIKDIPDDEWVYWTMDDRYLINIDEKQVNNFISWIYNIENPRVSSILLNRFDNLYLKKNLILGSVIHSPDKKKFIKRRNYRRIWNPQFLRVKVLKYLFSNFPDRLFVAKEMDYFKDKITVPEDHELYVSEQNYMVVGESASRGKITQNCMFSMKNAGIEIPENFEISDKIIIQGELLSKMDIIKNKLSKFVSMLIYFYKKILEKL